MLVNIRSLTLPFQVNDAIEKILRSRQTTCLIVAHRLSTIARAERIIVLEGASICPYLIYTWANVEQTVILPRPVHIVNWYAIHFSLGIAVLITVQVNRKDSRFRALMSAQLNAAAGESPVRSASSPPPVADGSGSPTPPPDSPPESSIQPQTQKPPEAMM